MPEHENDEPRRPRIDRNRLGQRVRRHVRLALLASVSGVLVGVAGFAFLEALDWATRTRIHHGALVWFLPVIGLVIAAAYRAYGGRAAEGNTILIREIHQPTAWVPRRMAPMVALASTASHLFGASVGREGAALQLSGSITDLVNRTFGVDREDRRVLLIAALSAGFGTVFIAPFAGMLFGLEVQWVRRLLVTTRRRKHQEVRRLDDARLRSAVIPCALASFIGAAIVPALGFRHPHRPTFSTGLTLGLTGRALLIGIAAGVAGATFFRLTEYIKHIGSQRSPWPVPPVVGGLLAVTAAAVFGRQYLGLSTDLVDLALNGGHVTLADPAVKLILTCICLGTGYIGGEVTPTFVIGATLGSALGSILGLAPATGAALGFAAVFAGAANTPITCTVLAIEAFGPGIAAPAFVACASAFLASGRTGLYHRTGGLLAPPPERDDESQSSH